MPSLPPFLVPKHPLRRRRRDAGGSPTPPVVNQIVSIVHGEDVETIVITVSNSLVTITDITDALEIFGVDDWYFSTGGSVDGMVVTLQFGRDVSEWDQWMLPDPSIWVFVNGEAMQPPFDGTM